MKYYGLLVLISLFIFGGAYYFSSHSPAELVNVAVTNVRHFERTIAPPKPCRDTLTYSIGTFDSRFGISRETFLADIQLAASAWEKADGRNLFEYSTTTGDFTVNLLYDTRQQKTEVLKEKKTDIGAGKTAYETLKAEYETLKASYSAQKANYDKLLAEVRSLQSDYNANVEYWNNQGGAPESEYAKLEQQRNELNTVIDGLNRAQDALNALGQKLNAKVAELNTVAQTVNAKVETYNTVAMQGGEEFSEGEYLRDETGTRVNIYQFENKEKLVRVLEHEFGHVLGLDHVADPNAIMYRLNSGKGTALTAADIAELARACGAKK